MTKIRPLPTHDIETGGKNFTRLKHLAQHHNREAGPIYQRFILKAGLRRLFASDHAGAFAVQSLKGGALMYFVEGVDPIHARATKDVDIQIGGWDGTMEELADKMREILSLVPAIDDGVRFRVETLDVTTERVGAVPGGTIKCAVQLGGTVMTFKCDVGRYPIDMKEAMELREFPSLLSKQLLPFPVWCQPREYALADKLHAAVRQGGGTGRMRDYYDMAVMIQSGSLDRLWPPPHCKRRSPYMAPSATARPCPAALMKSKHSALTSSRIRLPTGTRCGPPRAGQSRCQTCQRHFQYPRVRAACARYRPATHGRSSVMIPKFTFHDDKKLFFTADTHFGHSSQAKRRGYEDTDEHDNELIHRWNREVPKDGVVFHLGDFSWKTLRGEKLEKLFNRLNGRKFLVLGNHDDQKDVDLPWAAPPAQRMLVQIGSGDNQIELCLDHYGGRVWYNSHHGVIQIYGHSHGDLPATSAACDVGVDEWMLQPITLEDIKATLKAAKISMREVQDLVPGEARPPAKL